MSILPTFETRPRPGTRETDVIWVMQDSGKGLLAPKGPYTKSLEKLKKSENFNGAFRSTQWIRWGGKSGAKNLLFIGLGKQSEITAEKMRQVGALVYLRLQAEKSTTASVSLEGTSLPALLVRAFAEGMALRAYEFKKYKSKKEPPTSSMKVSFITQAAAFKKECDEALSDIAITVQSVHLARDWSNEPNNVGTPEYYANEAKKLAAQYGVKCKILSEADCKKEKMNLFLGVGQGSVREGKVIVLEYTPKGVKNPKTVALVGKGITFDTGGISIKPAQKMEDMKHDMSGAATCLGAFLLAARRKVKNRVIAVLGMTENMPDGDAITPGYIITARSGKTVEIQNTDAEGRLILADLLDYAHEFKPDVIVNAATLTGAVVVALGKYCCGLMANDDGIVKKLNSAGAAHGERLWELPMYDEYLDDIVSDYADLKNIGAAPQAGTIVGGMFLKQFIRKGVKWAHLDIAATAWDLGYLPYHPKKGASGSYVRTLAQFVADYDEN